MRTWSVRAFYDVSMDDEMVSISFETMTGERQLATLTFHDYPRGSQMSAIAFGSLHSGPASPETENGGRQFLQACMDAAWERGLRPTRMAGMEQSLKAVTEHRDDMRTLAFKGVDALIAKMKVPS